MTSVSECVVRKIMFLAKLRPGSDLIQGWQLTPMLVVGFTPIKAGTKPRWGTAPYPATLSMALRHRVNTRYSKGLAKLINGREDEGPQNNNSEIERNKYANYKPSFSRR